MVPKIKAAVSYKGRRRARALACASTISVHLTVTTSFTFLFRRKCVPFSIEFPPNLRRSLAYLASYSRRVETVSRSCRRILEYRTAIHVQPQIWTRTHLLKLIYGLLIFLEPFCGGRPLVDGEGAIGRSLDKSAEPWCVPHARVSD